MKITNTALFALLIAMGSVAHAAPKQYNVKIVEDTSSFTIGAVEGEATPLALIHDIDVLDCKQTILEEIKATQHVKKWFNGGFQMTVLPLPRKGDDIQVAIALTISRPTMANDAIELGKECRIVPGIAQSLSFSAVETFEPGKPKRLALPDGWNVTVTVAE